MNYITAPLPTFQTVSPGEWLTDEDLTERGRRVREEYSVFCSYLENMEAPSHQVARAKYHLFKSNYWTMPDGYALPPHTINVNPNNLCNFKCHFCDFGARHEDSFYHKYNVIDNREKIDMALDLCKSIVDQAAWFRPVIRASFREPMLYKNILPFIEYAKGYGLPFWLLTNGFNVDRYAKDLVGLGLDLIRISVDGPETVHDSIRGVPGSFRKIMNGVKSLVRECEERQHDMQIGFYFTLTDRNYDRILETVDALDSEGVLKHCFLNFQWLLYTSQKMADEHNATDAKICGGHVDESTVSQVDISAIDVPEVTRQAAEVERRFPATSGYRIHFRPSWKPGDMEKYLESEDFPIEEPRCRVPWYNMNINPTGDTKSFHHCLLPVAGNVNDDTIMDIWNGAELRDQRVKLRQHGAYRGCARCWGLYSLLEDTHRKV